MKKIFTLLALVFCLNGKAQYVTIPDTAFVNWLTINYGTAMNGNQMDTTNSLIATAQNLYVDHLNIADLTGIEYFDSLLYLQADHNKLSFLPTRLPTKIQSLGCENNLITSLPSLYNYLYLTGIYCDSNQLTSLPNLPNNLVALGCSYNNITSLPYLPDSLKYLFCGNNLINSLPNLPSVLLQLRCDGNLMSNLPSIPTGVYLLSATHNQLTSCPNLPNGLQTLYLSYNNITCFPVFPSSLNGAAIIPNPFTCLPNYLYSMDAATLAYPLCMEGNTNGCATAKGIVGFTYKDNNGDCIKNNGDLNLINLSMKLLDTTNNQLSQTFSSINGVYNFSKPPGKYIVKVDTTAMPFTIQCQHPGIDSALILTNSSQLDSNVNFSFSCKPGFDIGVQSVITSGLIFPGTQHKLYCFIGDMMSWYTLNCANGISGQVQITVTGNVTYIGPDAGALTPTVNGNTYIYNISDFGTVTNWEDFNLVFAVDSTAITGDTICVNINITPIVGDNNTSNNNFQYCYVVSNSHDPNRKEVYPVNVAPLYNNWFTYTIHFQNTGNAPAMNIRVTDVLDANLDLTTFQVINYSHPNYTYLNGNIVSFNFPNINLSDSVNNPGASLGYVQYKIKPKSGLTNGKKIYNKANIYFDYNPAIVTNTTINTFTTSVVTSIKRLDKKEDGLIVYPNPTQNTFTIETTSTDKQTLQLFDIAGKLVLNQTIEGKTTIDVSLLNDGVYNLSLISAAGVINKRLVIIK